MGGLEGYKPGATFLRSGPPNGVSHFYSPYVSLGIDPGATAAFEKMMEKRGASNGQRGIPQTAPDTNPLNLPELFYLGLVEGYKVSTRTGLIMVSTESDREEHRALLIHTLGRRGEVHNNKTKVTINLNAENFSYLTSEIRVGHFIGGKGVDTYLYGVFQGRRRDLATLVSHNPEVMAFAVESFEKRHNIVLGKFGTETRGSQLVRVLNVADPDKTFDILEQECAQNLVSLVREARSHKVAIPV